VSSRPRRSRLARPAPKSVPKDRHAAMATGAVTLGIAALTAPGADAATFNVTNLNDSGAGSLREALVSANTTLGADVVTFQSGLSGTITLTSGELHIYDSVDVQGPGVAVLSVSGDDTSRVFYVYSPVDPPINVTISGLTITNGFDPSIGGGIFDAGANLTLDHDVITNSFVGEGAGGGVAQVPGEVSTGTIHILDTTISVNQGFVGAGLFLAGNDAPAEILDSVISGNMGLIGGGIAFYYPTDDITIARTTISGNTATYLGGGIALYGTFGGKITIDSSTISGNSAGVAGGGLAFYYASDLVTIQNSTISGNQAPFVGGAFIGYASGGLDISFSTISGNTGTTAFGGLYHYGNDLPLDNTIIAGNISPTDPDISGGATFVLNYSLVEDPGSATIVQNAGAIVGVDPQLGPLQNNGGPTETHLPALNSVAIDAGDPAYVPPPATDQRGFARKVAAAVDMGAVEVNGGTFDFSSATYSVNEDGVSVTITVNRTGGTDPASVDYTTSDGSASAGADYTLTSGTFSFLAGETSAMFVVPILDDTLVEGDETFNLALSNPSPGSTLGAQSTAVVTIIDFEPGTVQFSAASTQVREDQGPLVITVTRTGGSDGPLTVNFATSDGTANAGSDYTDTSGSVTFGDGDATPKTITIPIKNDFTAEPPEDFTVTLSGPSAGSVGAPGVLTATIVDPPPPIPLFGWLGKMLLALFTAITGVFVIHRNRIMGILFAALLIGSLTLPAHAQWGQFRANRPEQRGGTLASVVKDGANVTFTLTDGKTLTVPASKVRVIDRRDKKRVPATLQDLKPGMNLKIVQRTNPKTHQTRVKVKILGP